MTDRDPTAGRLTFGPFEVDPVRGQLFKRGLRIRVPAQALQILIHLLARPGEVVTREELQQRIWSDSTVVDFEHGLNVAMNRLRRALGDSAENARYILTVPGRGYQFIGRVDSAPAGRSVAPEAPDVVLQKEPAIVPEPTVLTAVPGAKTKWWIAAGVVIVAVTLWVFLPLHRGSTLTAKDVLVIADLTNRTGDRVFDDMLRQGLIVQLEQSPVLSLLSEERIQQQLRLMEKAAGTRFTADLAREVCERTGSSAVLDGSITTLGSQYVLGFNVRNCSNGEMLDSEQTQAAKKEDVLAALDQITRRFRARAGESLAAIAKHTTPLAEATTPSLEALKAYSTAWQQSFAAGPNAAIPQLNRAIELDANFATAYAFLASLYGSTGESELAAKHITTAYRLRDRASEHERFFITLSYDLLATGNLARAEKTGQLWAQTYPRDAVPHGLLSWLYQFLGNYQAAVDEAKEAIKRDPDFVFGYNNLAWTCIYLNRLDEAENTIQTARARKLLMPDFWILQYSVAFLKKDAAGMERSARHAKENAGDEDWIWQAEALALGSEGHLQQAERSSQNAIEAAKLANRPERAAMYCAGTAILNAFLGNTKEARREATAALDLSRGRDVEFGAAFALALAHEETLAQRLTEDLGKRFSQDTVVQVNYLPTLRALAALKTGDASRAIELLQIAAPYELATPGSWFGFFGSLYPAYVRGQAYLAKNQPSIAAAEFQKILDHPTLTFTDPVRSAAHLELARALNRAGNHAKARGTYQDFLARWRNADPGIPLFEQTKTELREIE